MNLTPWQLAIARGQTLYPWQVEALEAFGRGYPVAAVAANGSGKTTMLAGNAVAWFLSKHPRGQVVATSSSFNQLQNQTWPAIREMVPPSIRMMGKSLLRIETPEGGFGIGFSTKEAGRAEGYHPKISPDVDPVMILMDEAKSVPDAIWSAFDRCTVAYSMFISSAPIVPAGRFYDAFHSLKKYYWTRKIPSSECPHIPKWKIEKDRELMDESVFRSAHEAEFGTGSEFLAMTPEALQAATLLQPPRRDTGGETVAFFDFARGGDENVFALRRGNHIRIVKAWRDRDTVRGVREFIRIAREIGIHASSCWGDADGLGGPMVDQFHDQGFLINEFHGGAAAKDSVNYNNLISEVWIEGLRRLQRGDFNFGELDPDTKKQLTTRYFEWTDRGKKRIESKDKMRLVRQLPSPDRADALLGCIMCGSHMTGAITAESVATGTITSPYGQFSPGVITGW